MEAMDAVAMEFVAMDMAAIEAVAAMDTTFEVDSHADPCVLGGDP